MGWIRGFQRRFLTVVNHFSNGNCSDQVSFIRPNLTAGEFFSDEGYSVVLPEKLKTGKWNVYRSRRSPLKLVGKFVDHPNITTLHDNFVYTIETHGDKKYLGTQVREDGKVGEYKWMTYEEAGVARSAIGSGLIRRGVQKGNCVGLYFVNRPEWLIVDHACSTYSYISVPLYDTLVPEAVKYIVNHAAAQAIFCVPQTLTTLLSFFSEIPSVNLFVVVGGVADQMTSFPSATGVKIVSYSELYSEGHNSLFPFSAPSPDDVATICYTSGTTGTPKVVVLTHRNLISNVAGASMGIKLYPSDVYISYLPLAHIYERANQITLVYFGGASGFYQGDNLNLLDDVYSQADYILQRSTVVQQDICWVKGAQCCKDIWCYQGGNFQCSLQCSLQC